MDNNEKTSEKITKWLLVGISVLFLAVMLLLPLITVITEALRSGWKVYAAAVTDEYTIKALLLTVKATLDRKSTRLNSSHVSHYPDRPSGYYFPCYCRFDLSSDFRTTESCLLFSHEVRD